MTYNIWNKWDTLETVMLGSFYPAEFFRDIRSDRIRSALTRIADEEAEDNAQFERVLQSHGVEVIRPHMDPTENIMQYIDDQGRIGEQSNRDQRTSLYGIPRAPIAPRDCQFVLGNHLFVTQQYDHAGILHTLNDYCDHIVHLKDIPIDAPNYTVVGHRLLIDTDISQHHHMIPKDPEHLRQQTWEVEQAMGHNIQQITDLYPDVQIEEIAVGAHNDGCFHTVADGAIISVEDMDIYEQTFPGWEVCYMPDEDWSGVRKFVEHSVKLKKSWWLPGEEDNDEFTHFVETWLQDWVGYADETVSAVNVLMINPQTCCTVNAASDMKQFMKKHGIDCVDIPNRHRFILDSGLSCKTLDLKRKS